MFMKNSSIGIKFYYILHKYVNCLHAELLIDLLNYTTVRLFQIQGTCGYILKTHSETLDRDGYRALFSCIYCMHMALRVCSFLDMAYNTNFYIKHYCKETTQKLVVIIHQFCFGYLDSTYKSKQTEETAKIFWELE